MSAAGEQCCHCGAEVPPAQRIVQENEGVEHVFCCRGCHGAYLLITGVGLGEFYRRREWGDAGLPAGAYQEQYSDSYLAPFVRHEEGDGVLEILIDGIRCASCAWLNEKILARLDGVRDVRVNYATSRARVKFDPTLATPSRIFQRIADLGYLPRPYTLADSEAAAAREKRGLLIRFGTAFFFTMQLMAYSFALYAGYFQGIAAGTKMTMQLFSLLVTTPVVFYCGWPFLVGAWRGLKNRAPGMDLLIAIGALSSYFYSVYALFGGGEVYFETAAMIVTLILFGRLLEHAARRRAAAGIERFLSLAPPEAQRLTSSGIERVATASLRPGDTMLVGAGERFPVDGRISVGATEVDESPATGEALPVTKGPGASVIGGSINLTGTVQVTVDLPLGESFIARVARLVEEAQNRRAPVQQLADRIAALFVPVVLVLAGITLCWQLAGGAAPAAALMTALAVVLIACPCALGLATPTAILAGSGVAAASGVIFKGGDVLERLARVTVVAFDKTGTLTRGEPRITEILPAPGISGDRLLELAAAVEAGSTHPLARTIVAEHARSGGKVTPAEDLLAVAGGGVTGMVAGMRVAAGSRRFLQGKGVAVPDDLQEPAPGETVVYLSEEGRYRGTVVLQDAVREGASDIVRYFQERGVACHLLSGDRQESARTIARQVGIENVRGDLLPADKGSLIEDMQRRGAIVLMAGDGINDAPALATAAVGCALAGGTDIAIETSDLVLAKGDLARLRLAHRLARRTMGVVRQNLGWAFIYNLVGIPLAMTGRLTPVYAAAAMALSSLCVVANSLRLQRSNHG